MPMTKAAKARRAEIKDRVASYQPLKVTARLRCGVIADGLLPLDAVLYFAAHRRAFPGERIVSLSRDLVPSSDERVPLLPLKRVPTGTSPDFFYAASAAQWPAETTEGIAHWTKQFRTRYTDLLEPPRAKLNTSGGAYRGYRMPVAYRHALALTWFVVGEPIEIRELLALVTHLGKKTVQGWGAVIDWTVAPHDHDWSVTGPNGEVMRPVPQEGGILHGVRPPYWLPRHQLPCALPV